jgi:hypothetical protein
MKHDSFAEVGKLLALREKAVSIVDAARSGSMSVTSIFHEGSMIKISGDVVPEEYLRQAIIDASFDAITSADKQLNVLGVSTPEISEPPENIDDWRRAAEMYLRVWARELGSVEPKRHLIDSLALATQRLREKAMLHSGPVVPKAVYDARVKELIEFNNRLEERARVAERKLKKFMDGSDAERLALAVEQAAAATIASINRAQR